MDIHFRYNIPMRSPGTSCPFNTIPPSIGSDFSEEPRTFGVSTTLPGFSELSLPTHVAELKALSIRCILNTYPQHRCRVRRRRLCSLWTTSLSGMSVPMRDTVEEEKVRNYLCLASQILGALSSFY
ncbi:hypothetical protein SCLCIDRAFT_247953 [Scleroderma citrinum Foug A]|uniref:Uncharacterized protein n=1 Tax=Scleroderma citrinum Foug A TaxID=1036808 RepID=A0A0C2ZUX1_9AGAM|nr:hypothetical protein SCLCIDRAFT_247953 [Scleroderma citrinum Foug A]